jgi:membrane protein implicated in regulation of membrane protease activity
MKKNKKGGALWPHLIQHLVGEIGVVTVDISGEDVGVVRISGDSYPATSGGEVKRGRWVRVLNAVDEVLHVKPLNIWLGSCCC